MEHSNINYLDLLKITLTGINQEIGEYRPKFWNGTPFRLKPLFLLDKTLRKFGYTICQYLPFDYEKRLNGQDHPTYADTMVGVKRLSAIERFVTDVIARGVEGDLIMAGAWRGGASVLMQAILSAYNETHRNVWVCDSFEGLPKPIVTEDKGHNLYKVMYLAVSEADVRRNFEKYNLLDENVHFIKGWFEDTLHKIPTEKYSLIYADGDLYKSTDDILKATYNKLQPGGYLIVDDYYSMSPCRQAISDFRDKHNITDPIKKIDFDAVYWQKSVNKLMH